MTDSFSPDVYWSGDQNLILACLLTSCWFVPLTILFLLLLGLARLLCHAEKLNCRRIKKVEEVDATTFFGFTWKHARSDVGDNSGAGGENWQPNLLMNRSCRRFTAADVPVTSRIFLRVSEGESAGSEQFIEDANRNKAWTSLIKLAQPFCFFAAYCVTRDTTREE